MAAQADPESLVLDDLDFSNVGGGGVGIPDRGCIGVDGLDDGFERGEHGFLGVTPLGAGEGFEDVDTWGHLPADIINMFVEGKRGVERDPDKNCIDV